MSDSQTYDPVTVSSDGVTVAKRFEADEFPVPAIAFRIESTRDETVTVRIVDTVPEDVAVEDLGFHPEYGSEYWTIDDQQITFERDMEAESEYTTVYGIRSTGTDNVEQFLTQPTIEMVDPPLEGEDGNVLDESSSDVVKDVIAGESDSVPGLEDDEDEEEIGTLNLKDPNEPGGGVATGEAAEGEAAAGEDGEGGATTGTNVTRALLAEIKRGEVEDEILAALKQTLGNGAGGGAGGGAADARIQHLQNEVSDLAAYTEALEEFLAENGTGEQMIEDFQTRLTSFQDELDEIQSMAVENREVVEGMESTVSQVDNKVDSMDETVDTLEGSVSQVESEVDEMGDTIESVTGEVDEMGDTVGSLEGRVDEVDAEVDEGLSSLESEVEDLRNELDSVEESIGDVSDVDDRLDDIEGEIEELKQWREQLSSVIGGGGD